MSRQQMNRSALLFFMLFVFSGCVTVKLDTGMNGSSAKRAEGVSYKEPGQPFVKEQRSDVDASWQNPRNGNVISFITDCKDPSDPSLQSIVGGMLAGLPGLKIESDQEQMVQGREGRRVLASGKVDGVPSQTDLLVFKRNQCIYVLSYVGVKKSFNEDRAEFERFIQGFRAP
ncbi:MAG: hypothetical protein HC902_00155 [Calothrix sp. SM1_5_4]|nr:hypothetical protein [Calothrix sp. SM1_5_4]